MWETLASIPSTTERTGVGNSQTQIMTKDHRHIFFLIQSEDSLKSDSVTQSCSLQNKFHPASWMTQKFSPSNCQLAVTTIGNTLYSKVCKAELKAGTQKAFFFFSLGEQRKTFSGSPRTTSQIVLIKAGPMCLLLPSQSLGKENGFIRIGWALIALIISDTLMWCTGHLMHSVVMVMHWSHVPEYSWGMGVVPE